MKKIFITLALVVAAVAAVAQSTNNPFTRSTIWNTNQIILAGWNYTNTVNWSGTAWTNTNTKIFVTNAGGLFSLYRTNLLDTNAAVIGTYRGVSGNSNVVASFATISLAGNSTNAPGDPIGGGSVSSIAPGQRGAFNTSILYFATSNSPYSNFVWVGTAYSNSTLHSFIRTNSTLHVWQYLTNGVLVATNPTATNVWRGTNGVFRGTSYWANVSLSGSAPGFHSAGGGVSTNLPIRAFYVTTNYIPVQSTNLLIAAGFSITGANGHYIWKANLAYQDDNTDQLVGGYTNLDWTALSNPNPGFSDGTYFLRGADQAEFYLCASTNDIVTANTFAASATLIGTNNWASGASVRYGFITNITYTTNYYH